MASGRLTIWIIWFALLSSIGIYAGLSFVLDPVAAAASEGFVDSVEGAVEKAFSLKDVLLKVGIGMLVLSFVLRLALITTKPHWPIQKSLGGQVAVYAVVESAAVFALVLRITGDIEAAEMLKYLAVTAVVMVLHAPVWSIVRA